MVKKIACLIVALSLALALIPGLPVSADTDGDVSGEFTVGTPPSVDVVSLIETSMTPQVAYTVTVTVTDADSLNDLSEVELKVWYDSNGGTPTGTEYSAANPETRTCAVITWDGSIFSLASGASSTWSLGNCTVPTLANTTGDFTFEFLLGKVAYETTGSNLWQIGAKATDTVSAFDWNFDPQGSAIDWYGEITVPSATVNWGTLTGGTDFTDLSAQQGLGVTVNFVSNGNFAEKVKSSASWIGVSETATLDATGTCGTAGEFSLKADDSTNSTTSILVDTVGVTIQDDATRTNETGLNETVMTLWIKLAGTFPADTYGGTITYSIVNR